MKKPKRITLDYSTISDWYRCEELVQKRLVVGISGKEESSPLVFGDLWHRALGLWQVGNPVDLVLRFIYSEGEKTILKELEGRRSLGHLAELFDAYTTVYGTDPQKDFKPLNDKNFLAETILEMPIGTRSNCEYWYRGSIDLAALDTQLQQPALIERKTSYALGRQFALMANTSHQATGYLSLLNNHAQELGIPTISNVIYEGAKTSGERSISKDPWSYFTRVYTHRSQFQIDEWRNWSIRAFEGIHDQVTGKRIPTMNRHVGCTAYNSTCPFLEICNSRPEERHDIGSVYLSNTWPNAKIEWE